MEFGKGQLKSVPDSLHSVLLFQVFLKLKTTYIYTYQICFNAQAMIQEKVSTATERFYEIKLLIQITELTSCLSRPNKSPYIFDHFCLNTRTESLVAGRLSLFTEVRRPQRLYQAKSC